MITVIVPTYNRHDLLDRALQSIAEQTVPFRDYEVIVVNDGGAPPKRVAPDGLRIQWFDRPHLGLSAAVNFGVSQSDADYITIAADDDTMLPNKLEDLRAILSASQYPEVGASYGLAVHTDRQGNGAYLPTELARYAKAHPVVTRATIDAKAGLHIHGTAVLYRREVFDVVGGWDETIRTAEEYDFHLRMLWHGYAFACGANPQPVVTYASGGKSRLIRRSTLRQRTMHHIYKKLAEIDAAKNAEQETDDGAAES